MVFYETGEVARVGDEVEEPVNGNLHGLVVGVLEPGSPEAHRDGFPCGGIYVRWEGSIMALDFWTTGALTEQPDCLWFVGRDTGFVPSKAPLQYRSRDAAEKGDLVMESGPGGEREGTVVGILQPESDEAASAGHAGGGLYVGWEGDPVPHFLPTADVVVPRRLFFCGRAADADSVLRYRCGRIAYGGDEVEERGADNVRRGRVVRVAQAGSVEAVGQKAASGVFVAWEGDGAPSVPEEFHSSADVAGPTARVFLVGRKPW